MRTPSDVDACRDPETRSRVPEVVGPPTEAGAGPVNRTAPVLRMQKANPGAGNSRSSGVLFAAQASTTGRTGSESETTRVRPVLVVARSITAPVRADWGTEPAAAPESVSRGGQPLS